MKFTEEKRNKNMLIIFMFNDKDKYLGNYAIKKKEDVFIIDDVFIDPDERGKGLCAKIINHATENYKDLILNYFNYKKVKSISLYVYLDNEPAMKCYFRAGFKEKKRYDTYLYLTYKS